MTHFLTLPVDERPDLPTRETNVGKIEVRCPCGQWRPGYCLAPVDPPREGKDWACDGCRTRWEREAAAL